MNDQICKNCNLSIHPIPYCHLDDEIENTENVVPYIKDFISKTIKSKLEAVEGELPLEKIHQLPDDVGSPHETEHDRGWNDYRKVVLEIINKHK